MNRFGVGLSTLDDPVAAVEEACARAASTLDGREPDLVCLFASPAHAEDAEGIASGVVDRLRPAACTGAVGPGGIIGGGHEVEDGPALAVWAASLPDAVVRPFRLALAEDDDGAAIVGDPGIADGGADSALILLADPYTFPADALLAELNASGAGRPVVGGLAGGGGPGRALLIDGAEVVREGAVGVAVGGARLLSVVSQGCRPLGPDLVVTAAERNVVLELAGRPALEKLREVVQELSLGERALVAGGLLAGLVVDENQPEYGLGDYLVRPVLGADAASGALVIGDVPRVGQTFRFHARDERSADEALHEQLVASRARLQGAAGGALLFSCNGRGTNLFGVPDHDAASIAADLGVPAAGLFCQGEIGPVGGQSHLHGFTATVALFPR